MCDFFSHLVVFISPFCRHVVTVAAVFFLKTCDRWSEFGYEGDNENDNGCGGDGGHDGGGSYAYWYMGHTQCFRANVAYSLYGIKASNSRHSTSRKNGCATSNYINSFFTFKGIESFADPLGIDYESYGANSACTRGDNPNGDEDENKNNNDNNPSHGQQLYGDFTSYGTGCSGEGEFIIAQFQGAFCDGAHYQATTDALQTLNSNLGSLGCYQVYSSDESNNGNNADNENENDKDKDKDEEDEERKNDGKPENSIAHKLLESSTTCNVIEYGTRCPDPFGLKRRRDLKLYKKATRHYARRVPRAIPIVSTIFCIFAVYITYLSLDETNKTMVFDKYAQDLEKRMSLLFRPSKDDDGSCRNIT